MAVIEITYVLRKVIHYEKEASSLECASTLVAVALIEIVIGLQDGSKKSAFFVVRIYG